MTKLLITGANGQLGREIKKISSQFTGFLFIFADAKILDIANKKSVDKFFENQEFDFLINCAAYTAVDKAESEPELANKVNNIAVGYLLEACKKQGCKFIHISTDYVFDGTQKNLPFIESDAVLPHSVYGKTKLEGELQLSDNKDVMVVRTAWLYSSFGGNFMQTMLRLAKEKKSLNVVFDQIGTPTYAGDLAFALLEIIKQSVANSEDFKAGIYHFSNEGVCSWYDFAVEIMKFANLDCTILPIETKDFPTAAKRPHFSLLNKSKIKKTFQLTIPHWRTSAQICFNEIMKAPKD